MNKLKGFWGIAILALTSTAWTQTPSPTTATGSPTESYGAVWGTPTFGASVSGGSQVTMNANDPTKAYVTGSAIGTGTGTYGTSLTGPTPLGAYSAGASSAIASGQVSGAQVSINPTGTAAQSNGATFAAAPTNPTSSANAWNTTSGGFNLLASGVGPIQVSGGAAGSGNSNAFATQTANSATGNFLTSGQSSGNLSGIAGGNLYANGQGGGMTQTALGIQPKAGTVITAPYAISDAMGGATYTTPATVGPTASGMLKINGNSGAAITPTSVSATATIISTGAITTPTGH